MTARGIVPIFKKEIMFTFAQLIRICLLLEVLAATAAFGQRDSLIEARRNQFHVDSLRLYGPKRRSFDFQFDNRNSFIQNRAIAIEGFNPGIVVNQKFRYGLGLYRVVAPYQQFRSTRKSSVSNENVVTNRELDMYFATPNFRYIFLKQKWIQISAELALGFGLVDFTIKNEANTKVLLHKDGVFIPSGGGIELVLIPIRWVGLGGSVGYRKSLGTYDINADFDGMYYSYGVKVFIGTIYKDLKFRSWKKRLAEDLVKLAHSPQ